MIPHVIKLSKSGSTKGVFVEPIQYAARDDLDSKAQGLAPVPEEDMGCVNIDFDLDTEEQRLWLAQAMTATSSRSVRFQGNPVYHVSISWPEGEHPTREQCEKAVHHFMKGLGMGENEAFWAIHRDTDNDHLHMIVNKVHPEMGIVTGPPRFDYALLHRLAREVELDQGWSHDAGAYVVTEPNPGKPQIMRRDIAVKMGLWKEDEIRRPNLTRQMIAVSEKIGAEPFHTWIAGQPAKDLREAIHQPGATWESVHQAIAKHGLQIQPKGSGLVVTSTLADGQVVAAKASQLGRWASKAALEKKLGPYRPPSALAGQAVYSYQDHIESAKTRSEYQHAGKSATDAKRAARREERARARQELAKRFEVEQKRWRQLRTQMRLGMRERHQEERRQLQAELREERKLAIAKDKADGVPFKVSQSLFAYRAALRREELQKRHAAERRAQAVEVRRSLDWRAWLEHQAEQGDEAAKAALRGIRYREQRKSKKYPQQDGIEGEELDPLRKLTVAALDAQIDPKRQLVIYRGADGRERFTDTGPRIVMHDKSDDSLEAALRMAAQKFGGKVDITGSSEFRERAARQAVRLGIEVVDADLQHVVADERARMQGERMPRRATKETEKASDLSPELVDKPAPAPRQAAPALDRAAMPKIQALRDTPREQAIRTMEQAIGRWLDGDRSSGPVKAFIAAHDRATRQGADGRALIAEVVDRVVTRRGDGVAADLGGFMASIERQRKRELGMGR